MKTQNMRDMQKRWADQRRKAEEKAAKVAPKKSEAEAETPVAKKDEATPQATAAPAKKPKNKKAAK